MSLGRPKAFPIPVAPLGGGADDSARLNDAATRARATGAAVELVPGATYKLTEPWRDCPRIIGNGAILSCNIDGADVGDGQQARAAILIAALNVQAPVGLAANISRGDTTVHVLSAAGITTDGSGYIEITNATDEIGPIHRVLSASGSAPNISLALADPVGYGVLRKGGFGSSSIASTTHATPIVLTTSTAHGLSTGDYFRVTGADDSAANGDWQAGTVGGGGTTVQLLVRVTGANSVGTSAGGAHGTVQGQGFYAKGVTPQKIDIDNLTITGASGAAVNRGVEVGAVVGGKISRITVRLGRAGAVGISADAGCSDLTIEDCDVDGGTLGASYCLYSETNTRVTWRRCKGRRGVAGISTYSGIDVRIEDCDVADPSNTAGVLVDTNASQAPYKSRGLVVARTNASFCANTGIRLDDLADGVVIEDCTADGCGIYGVQAAKTNSTSTVQRCVVRGGSFQNCGTVGILASDILLDIEGADVSGCPTGVQAAGDMRSTGVTANVCGWAHVQTGGHLTIDRLESQNCGSLYPTVLLGGALQVASGASATVVSPHLVMTEERYWYGIDCQSAKGVQITGLRADLSGDAGHFGQRLVMAEAGTVTIRSSTATCASDGGTYRGLCANGGTVVDDDSVTLTDFTAARVSFDAGSVTSANEQKTTTT